MNIVRDMNQLDEVEDLASRAGLLYRQAGSPESAAQLLVRAAKLLEVKDPARAVSLYQKAADTVNTEDRTTEAGQHLESAARLCVRTAQYDRAAELLEAALSTYSEGPSPSVGSPYGRVVLAFILVQQKRGDCVAASKVRVQCYRSDNSELTPCLRSGHSGEDTAMVSKPRPPLTSSPVTGRGTATWPGGGWPAPASRPWTMITSRWPETWRSPPAGERAEVMMTWIFVERDCIYIR